MVLNYIKWDDPFTSTSAKITKTVPQLIDPSIPNSFIFIMIFLGIGLFCWWIHS